MPSANLFDVALGEFTLDGPRGSSAGARFIIQRAKGTVRVGSPAMPLACLALGPRRATLRRVGIRTRKV